MKGIFLRDGIYYLRKRVPTQYQSIERRKIVMLSLHTDSRNEAEREAPGIWQIMEHAWEARLSGRVDDAERRFETAKRTAKRRGFKYLPAVEVANLPLDELLQRVDAAAPKDKPDAFEGRGILGGAKVPPITLNRALELYWDLAKDELRGKSEDQVRRWKNPRIKALRNLVDVIGNKPIAEISGDDMLEFRDWWIERIEIEDLTPNSANKDLTHIGDVLKTVNRMKRLGLVLPLTDLRLKAGEKRTRPPFSPEWIKTKLLAPGALDGLNEEARCILLACVNTGARPSEIAGLLPHHIHLDGPVPHISIEPEGRQLKNATSKRVIPLVGVSLDAMKACPKGFPTYRAKDRISNTVNKYLRENGLLETPAHSLYGLRHSLEDRLLDNGVDDRIRADLFGHAYKRERYGRGATLQHVHEVISAVAFF